MTSFMAFFTPIHSSWMRDGLKLYFFFLPLQETQYSIVVEDTNA